MVFFHLLERGRLLYAGQMQLMVPQLARRQARDFFVANVVEEEAEQEHLTVVAGVKVQGHHRQRSDELRPSDGC